MDPEMTSAVHEFPVPQLRCYLKDYKFTVITDNCSLRWLNNLKNLIGRLARWALDQMKQTFTIVHQRRACHHMPEALSRTHKQTHTHEQVCKKRKSD